MSIMNDNEKKPGGTTRKKKPQPAKKKFYKKAPQAPKRFKSAFIFFSAAKHKEIREQMGNKGGHEKTTNVAKLVSESWKNLSAEDKKEWEEKSRQDKIRYEMEKKLYTGPWRVQAPKRARKDPHAPKRPMSAFLAYSNSKRAGLKRQDPNLSNADVSRILSKMWKEAPQDVRQKYIDEEYELRQEYKAASAEWRQASEQRQLEEREKREKDAMIAVARHKKRFETQSKESESDISRSRQLSPLLFQGSASAASASQGLATPLSSSLGQVPSLLQNPFAMSNRSNLSFGGSMHSGLGDQLSSSLGSAVPFASSTYSLPSMYDTTLLATIQQQRQQQLLEQHLLGRELVLEQRRQQWLLQETVELRANNAMLSDFSECKDLRGQGKNPGGGPPL